MTRPSAVSGTDAVTGLQPPTGPGGGRVPIGSRLRPMLAERSVMNVSHLPWDPRGTATARRDGGAAEMSRLHGD